jgi:hypothetical protein
MFFEEAGSGAQRGKVLGKLDLTADVKLCIEESVVVVDGHNIHREDYSYYLVVGGVEIWGYDRDPLHPVSEHRHTGPGHGEGEPCGRVTLRDVAQEAWDYVSQHFESLEEV